MKYNSSIEGQNRSTSTSARQKRDSASEDVLIQISVLSKIKCGSTGLQIINQEQEIIINTFIGLVKYIQFMNRYYEIILP